MILLKAYGPKSVCNTLPYMRLLSSQAIPRKPPVFLSNRYCFLSSCGDNRFLSSKPASSSSFTEDVLAHSLPPWCPGCGAPSRAANEHEAGNYSLNRSAVKAYIGIRSGHEAKKETENALLSSALRSNHKDLTKQDSADINSSQCTHSPKKLRSDYMK